MYTVFACYRRQPSAETPNLSGQTLYYRREGPRVTNGIVRTRPASTEQQGHGAAGFGEAEAYVASMNRRVLSGRVGIAAGPQLFDARKTAGFSFYAANKWPAMLYACHR